MKAKFEKQVWENVSNYCWEDFDDPLLKREFKLMSVLGIPALPDDKLEQVVCLLLYLHLLVKRNCKMRLYIQYFITGFYSTKM